MELIYKEDKVIDTCLLQDLFLSVGWLSGNFPERLAKAIKNSDTVITAWDNDKLVGLINVLDDSELTAYIHYLLVDPKYQCKGIAKTLVKKIEEKYKDYLSIVLVSEKNETINFYQKQNFLITNDVVVMKILKK